VQVAKAQCLWFTCDIKLRMAKINNA